MLISYLVPVYNVKDYIRTCLDSILAQRGAAFEVVLLDDGSTDGSGDICDEYARKYPQTVRVIHKPNEGLFLTRRRGFREAKGDWFICVDSDDYILPDHLRTIAEAIRSYDCDMVLFDYISFYPDGRTEPSGIDIEGVQVYEGERKKELYAKRLLKNKYNNMWSKAVKRSVVDLETDYGVFGIKNMCEDAIQSYALYTSAEKAVYIPRPLYAYRRSIASISANVNADYWYALRVSYELGWQYLKQWDMPEAVSQAYAARCVCYYCDFLEWLLMKCQADANGKQALFQEAMLQNEAFAQAATLYRKEYLPTRYLRVRNPLIAQTVRLLKSYRTARFIFSLEKMLLRITHKSI